ncbi:MAG TPA: hypothetical protein VNS79_03620 [Sphingobium sp.]|nr:hypothetical protein [Sphingobium sp.]
MSNIERFEDDAARILGHLYKVFPVLTDIDARAMSEAGQPSRRFGEAIAGLYWLEDAGYISVRERQASGCLGATLTPLGLHLLGRDSGEDHEMPAPGALLIRYVAEGKSSLARDTVRSILAAGMKAGMK